MGLINLRTNLKDLKFGNDQYKNGSSNEPYIQTRIPATDEPLQTSISVSGDNIIQGLGTIALSAGAGAAIGGVAGAPLIGAIAGLGIGIAGATSTQDLELALQLPTAGTGGPDFLLRGGTLLPNIVLKDAVRLTKFFVDTKGILFTIKQNLLSRAGVRAQGAPRLLNERLYTPLSTIIGAVGSPFGLYVNKQGLNPFLGFGDTFVPDRYLSTISNEIKEANQSGGADIASNRLVGLFSVKMLGDNALSPFYKNNSITEDPYTLLSYSGGPGSILGIGRTNIRYATDNVDQPLSILNAISIGKKLGINTSPSYATLDYTQINEISTETKTLYPVSVDFRKKLKMSLPAQNPPGGSQTLTSNSPSYDRKDNKTIERRTFLGDPGYGFEKNLSSYTNGKDDVRINVRGKGSDFPLIGAGKGAASNFSFDRLNASGPINALKPENPIVYPDLITFKIEIIDNNTPNGNKTQLYFRAFLDQISDSYNSNWDATKYIGRGENFYTYSGFDRKISLGWTVAAQSKIELMQMYRRLNHLASICAPDYSGGGFMRGNIATLTIGGYIFEQPGIITGFSFEMNEENDTWEIAINDKGEEDQSVKQLPHIIKVKGFNFIPIHTFVPRIQNLSSKENGVPVYGPERYISLANRGSENYDFLDSFEAVEIN